MAPPLTITREECDVLIEAVAGALSDVLDQEYT
jgi:4-aminobutyrate aminotransferase-like enzyme